MGLEIWDDVEIILTGFKVGNVDPDFTGEDLLEVAEDIKSDVGSRLSALGRMSQHGEIEIKVCGKTATTA